MSRPTQITIDTNALRHNFQQVKKLAPHSRVIAMVKSNGYGHGIIRVAKGLTEADALGVACSEEGMLLREVGIRTPIVLMEGLFDSKEVALAERENFTIIVHHHDQIAMLEKTSITEPLSVWLKINTGMHRLGFEIQEAQNAYERLLACPYVKKPLGIMTHFAEADVIESEETQKQIALFESITTNWDGITSLANSAGILAWPKAHANWVRPGIMLYGVSPFKGRRGIEHGLQPVMTLSSNIIAIHHAKCGAKIGYGGTWVCPKDMTIGVVAIGYGDGYPWRAPNGTPLLVNNKICSLVGRVSMDMLTVDLSEAKDTKIGDPVVLWGAGMPVEKIAEESGTSPYELLTRITQRVRVEVR